MSYVTKSVNFKNKIGFNLVGNYTIPKIKPPFPVIIICHGFSSSKDSKSYTVLEKMLLPRGVAVFRFNYRGHGKSGGDWKDLTISGVVDDIKVAIDFLLREYGKFINRNKIILYGGSFSGLPVVKVASENKRIKYLICRSGVIDFQGRLERLYNIKTWKEKGYIKTSTDQKKLSKFDYKLYLDSQKFDGFQLGKKISIPTLLLHGTGDITVKPYHSVKLFNKLSSKDKELKLIKGVDHWYYGKRREMQKTIVNWIEKKL